jgi:hypothetical protein
MENIKYNSKQFESISLLNSEGPILTAFKDGGRFIILDEHKEIIASLDEKEIYNFTRGKLSITNSKEKHFNYSKFPGSMKPNLKTLDIFIGSDTTGLSY